MLDILELAREKGIEEGMKEGLEKGKTIGGLYVSQDMVIDTLFERFNMVASGISEGIRRIQNLDTLRGLLRQAIKCKDLGEFEAVLRQFTS